MPRCGLTSSGVSSMTSPSYTSLFSLMRRPMARRKFSMRISTFFTSVEYTSEPTIGTKGTLGPNSFAMPSAIAVLPVPGAPANSRSVNGSAAYLQRRRHRRSCERKAQAHTVAIQDNQPAKSTARPAIFFVLIRSTAIPAACRSQMLCKVRTICPCCHRFVCDLPWTHGIRPIAVDAHHVAVSAEV